MKITFKKFSMIISCLMLLMAVSAGGALAATYYVDYTGGSDGNSGTSKTSAWQRAPGMAGFSGGYSHASGDTFILKGGVTWPSLALPLTISYSGTSGKVDTYTTDHTWYNGSAWSQPIFNGNGNKNHMVTASSKGYWKVDDIKIVGVNIAKVANNYEAIFVSNCNNIEISNLDLAPESQHAITIANSSGTTKDGFLIHHNRVSHTVAGLIIYTDGSNSKITGAKCYNNVFADFASQTYGGPHTDGLHIWTSGSNLNDTIDGMQVYNNTFTGDWVCASSGITSPLTFERNVNNTLVYNNTVNYSTNTNGPAAYATSWGGTNAASVGGNKFYNNTFYVTTGSNYGIWFDKSPNGVVKNNIIYFAGGASSLIYTSSGAAPTVSYNVTFPTAKTGNINANPLLVSGSDLQLQSSSPCRNAGTALSEFSTDILGISRAQDTGWDIGAFEYYVGGGSTTKTLSPPSKLTVN
jgi:hypothetical protein